MDFKNELMQMRLRYSKKHMKRVKLPRPKWLTWQDPLSAVYKEMEVLLQQGEVYYAHIVQANTILFRLFPYWNCPAGIIYSTDMIVADKPDILQDIASMLYSYKNKKPEEIPEKWQEIARVITDEYDQSSYTFSVIRDEQEINVHFIPIMVFRKHLPKHKLNGSLLPVIAQPDTCRSVLILPKRYWSSKFKSNWINGII